jgi:hypothetical protein
MNIDTLRDPQWIEAMDPVADAAAVSIIRAGGVEAMSTALELLSNEPPDKRRPAGLDAFIDATPAPEVNRERIDAAQRWFSTWGAIGTSSLFCASLPETYCLPGIAQLLAISGQLVDHVTRRIRMTGQMVFDVMQPGGITENSAAMRALRRTRLMHGAIRSMLLHPEEIGRHPASVGGARRLQWSSEFGKPINQLELVYTLMTFSHVILRSAQRLGIALDQENGDNYIYTWNVAGRVLGIDAKLLPDDWPQAESVFETIKAMQARATDDAKALVQALEASWNRQFAAHHVPLARPLMHSLFQSLLTQPTRDMLRIKDPGRIGADMIALVMPAVEEIVHLGDALFRALPPAAHAAAAVNVFFARHETDDVQDRGMYDTLKHMRAWFDQVERTPEAV